MTRYRPQDTPKDENHFIPRDFLRDRCGGYEVVKLGRTHSYTANYRNIAFLLIDTSNYGGIFTDWQLFCIDYDKMLWIEIKTAEAYHKKDHELTDGEKRLSEIVEDCFRVVVTDEDFEQVMDEMLL